MLVGIDQYEDNDFPRPRAAGDALALARWLIDEAGWKPDHIQLLMDREPVNPAKFRDPASRPPTRPPTRRELDRAVGEWLPANARRGDLVVIFFAGQAVSLPDPAGAGRAGRSSRDYLIPLDAVRDREDTWWRLGDAIDGLASRGEASIVCLLDTSPAGRVRPPRRIEGVGREVAPERRLRMLEGIARWPGVTAWMAATERTAEITDEDGRGPLTAALLRALGHRGEVIDLHTCLVRLWRDRALAGMGFQIVGAFPQGLSLWPGRVRHSLPRVDPLLQRGHADRVTGIAFRGSDAGRIITTSQDSTVRIWRASDSFLLNVLPWATNGFESPALSGDGRLLAAGGGQGDVLFYDMDTETRLPGPGPLLHQGPVSRVVILPDGRHAVSHDGRKAVVWEVDLDARRVSPREPAEEGVALVAAATEPGPVAFALAVMPADAGRPRKAIRLGNAAGDIVKEFDLPRADGPVPAGAADQITALALSADGSRVVVATASGRVVTCDHRGNRVGVEHRLPDEPRDARGVEHLSVQPLWVMAGCGRSVWLLGDRGLRSELPLGEVVANVAASAGGRRVAACSAQGRVRAWEVAEDGKPRDIPLSDEVKGDGLSLAFSPDGKLLAVGDGSGQVRSWRIPQGTPMPRFAAPAAQVGHMAVSPDGLSLLQVSGKRLDHAPGQAVVWRFGDEHGTRPVPGGFLRAGGFLNDGRLVLIDEEGSVVVHDGRTLQRLGRPFERPRTADGNGQSSWKFTTLAVARNAPRVAAGSLDGPLACVWSTDGKLVKTIRDEQSDKILAVDFSEDGRSLLTAGDDGLVRVWDLAGEEAVPRRPARELAPADGAAPTEVKAAAVSPGPAPVIAAGRLDGRIDLWRPGEAKARVIGRAAGAVRAVAFSRDGRWMAAGGDDPRITLVDPGDPGEPEPLATIRGDRRPRPHHNETITALAFWPDGRLLASASMDSTVRLWDLKNRRLVATMAALDDGVEWVSYTPEGLFDGSRAGETRVAWRLDPNWWLGEGDGLIARFDQLGPAYRRVDLVDNLAMRGQEPEPPRFETLAAPRLIVEPVSAVGPAQREVELRIRSSTPDLRDLRLYHNGASLNLARLAARPDPAGHGGTEYTATVKLVYAKNVIYALGSRKANGLRWGESPDALSNTIELDCRVKPPARVHILAIGVSQYRAQALRYAHEDARAMAEFLRSRGLEGASVSEPIVLVDTEVTNRAVDDAFETLRRRVEGRPEDILVVFLAGHATIRRGVFSLLLPGADLPERPPMGEELAFRGPEEAEAARPAPAPDDPTLLPYSRIHGQLAFAEALNRLVIIDACQAEAILDVVEGRAGRMRRAYRRHIDELSHRARTSYILATRRGERAVEATELGHGLLTYTLLRGMGAPGLARPAGLEIFEKNPSADSNRDGWIEAAELRDYARLTLPVLVDRFRGRLRGGPQPESPEPTSLAGDVPPAASFLLIPAPRGASRPAPGR
ncbi:MAG: WD40 domain-containing protein [Isosphaeraceae bacterium]